MSFFTAQISDIHLTTLITYLATLLFLTFIGKKRQHDHLNLFLFVTGLMIVSVLSFEAIYVPVSDVLTHAHFLGLSSVLINLAIIIFAPRRSALEKPKNRQILLAISRNHDHSLDRLASGLSSKRGKPFLR